jgi:6-phosphogluconolactonase
MTALRPRERVRVVTDALELARGGADVVRAAAAEALAQRAAFHLALAGGSTPRGVYAELARRAAPAELARWHVWFGDERGVPPDDRASNHHMARESGLLALVPPRQVHRLRGEAPQPAAEAERYARELCAALGTPPRLDLVLLGLGADGHTASLFPGDAALEAAGWVSPARAPVAPEARLTLTLATLRAARSLAFLVSGADKARALSAVFAPAGSDLPARRAYPHDGGILWLLDRAAAGELALAND